MRVSVFGLGSGLWTLPVNGHRMVLCLYRYRRPTMKLMTPVTLSVKPWTYFIPLVSIKI